MIRGHQRLDGISILTLEGLIERGCDLVDGSDGFSIPGLRRSYDGKEAKCQ
jgi:hypothetical protein